jgi:hypothetical protein
MNKLIQLAESGNLADLKALVENENLKKSDLDFQDEVKLLYNNNITKNRINLIVNIVL